MTTSVGKLIPAGMENHHSPYSKWSNYRCVQTNTSLMRLAPGMPAQACDTREALTKCV